MSGGNVRIPQIAICELLKINCERFDCKCFVVNVLSVNILDDQINWKHHIRKVQNKICLLSIIGIVYRIRDKIYIKTSLLLYDALIGSHLSYCNIV